MLNTVNSETKSSINWKNLFTPDSVAVIGASNIQGTWGYNITWRLLNFGKRAVYLVNPYIPEVQGIATYNSILDIPAHIDLAIIAVPAKVVPGILRECGQKGIDSVVIISGGFAEADEEGAKLQEEIIRIAEQEGIRFIGPNTMGHFNNQAQFSILAWSGGLASGGVALISQSGNCGSRILNHGKIAGVGFSKFVCAGNEASLHLEDYLEYFAQDKDTTIITTYIEGLREKRRFYELAREITQHKPIVALKSGGTGESARAARSHTGALTGSAAVYTAAFRQAGVIEVDNDDELLDVVVVLLRQPLPRGKRVGIITVGGGLGVVAAEACEREGLVVTQLSPSTIERLNTLLPPRWSHANPVDTVGINALLDSENIISCLWALLEDDNIDAIIMQMPIIFPPSFVTRVYHYSNEEARAFEEKQHQNLVIFRERVEKHQKPVLVVTPLNDPETMSYITNERIPVYTNPRRAARVIRHLAWYQHVLSMRQK